MARLLVVEDDEDLQTVLAFALQNAGHEVVQAVHGAGALEQARQQRFDLILLDLMLPDLAGTEVCRTLREDPRTRRIPVIMLTARGEEIDRVVGFELGADDYITKPFSVRELLLRIRVILRRAGVEQPTHEAVAFGALRLDREAHRAWVRGAEVELTAVEFRLLLALFDRRNRVQSRDALLEQVWGLDTAVGVRTVDAHVKRLRQKLGDARDYVETVRGVGYRFAEHPEASPR